MRVSDRLMFQRATASLSARTTTYQKALMRLADGRAIQKPSDDPVRFERARSADARGAALKALHNNASGVMENLSVADSALADLQNTLARAGEIATMAASDQNREHRTTFAIEIDALFGGAVAAANSKVGDAYIFAGARSDAPAFDENGTYQGSTQEVAVEVAPGLCAVHRFDGSSLLQVRGTSMFGLLDQLQAALRADDTVDLRRLVGEIEAATSDLGGAQIVVGTQGRRVAQAVASLEIAQNDTATVASHARDADIIEEASTLALSQRALEGLQQSLPAALDLGLLKVLR